MCRQDFIYQCKINGWVTFPILSVLNDKASGVSEKLSVSELSCWPGLVPVMTLD